MMSTDAVVLASAWTKRGSWDSGHSTWGRYSVEVEDVYYLAGEKSPKGLLDPIAPGSAIGVLVEEAAMVDTPGELIMFLGGVVPEIHLTDIEAWALSVSAVVRTDGSVDFLGAQADRQDFDGLFAALVEAVEGEPLVELPLLPADVSRPLEVAVAFAKEAVEVNYRSDHDAAKGPLFQAYYFGPRSQLQDWLAIPPAMRPLDVEATPPAILSQLETVPVFVSVEGAARAATGRLLVLRNHRGVSHAAEIAAGSHPASVLVTTDGPWEVLITPDPYTGSGAVIGTFDFSGLSADLPVLMLEVRPEAAAVDVSAATADLFYPVATAISQQEFDLRLGDLALVGE